MQGSFFFLLGTFVLAAGIGFVWRLASRRRTLPCPVWLRWFVELNNPLTKTNQAAFIVAHMELEPGMKVLDAGCGPGRLTIPLAHRVGPEGEVMALDIQEGMLSLVGKKAAAAGIANVRFLQMALGTGHLGVNRFDRALLATVLGEIPDQVSALTEIFDALIPGGMLTVTEVIFDPHFQGRNRVLRLTSAIGFREKAFFGNRIAFTLNLEKPAAGLLESHCPPTSG
jgi:precorrin-6B methylase 2